MAEGWRAVRRLLAGLGGEDSQALLSWGHGCQGLHLPSPTGGLLEVHLQDILQLGAIQHIGNAEHQHCLRHWLELDLEREFRDEQSPMRVRGWGRGWRR